MFQSVFNSLFGCAHQRTTFPMTPGHRKAGTVSATPSGTYVACLDCGQEFAYDWKSMQVGEQMAPRTATTQVQPSFR